LSRITKYEGSKNNLDHFMVIEREMCPWAISKVFW
jgi:hypothetical protein